MIKKVKIGHVDYTLKKQKALSDAGASGVCGTDTQEIVIDNKLGSDVEKETVLHELLHGIWHQTTLERLYTDEDEEKIVWSLAPFIILMCRENPALVKYLFSR